MKKADMSRKRFTAEKAIRTLREAEVLLVQGKKVALRLCADDANHSR
jgi:hypothetical protein